MCIFNVDAMRRITKKGDFMKKTRKVLSVVLSLLVAFGSMPIAFSVTAADAVTYATNDTGTIDNPTLPLVSTGGESDGDAYKVSYEVYDMNYTFYQTKNNEYFAISQYHNFQRTDGEDVELHFQDPFFYEGGAQATTNASTTYADGYGRKESPVITTNPTTSFINNYLVDGWAFTPTNDKAKEFVGVINTDDAYSWTLNVTFKGNTGSAKGEINTGFYIKRVWDWYRDGAWGANYELNIGTSIRILDAREFVTELAKVKAIVENPENYTAAYVSSAQAILNDIPDDLEALNAVYAQSVIDAHTEEMKNLSLNAADYREYNTLYYNLSNISNAKGAYTDESFAAFKTEISDINSKLSKALDKTQQATVNAAVDALRAAFDKLISTDLSDSNTSTSTTVGGEDPTTYTVDNTAFKFMQTKDGQEFKYTQTWVVARGDGSNQRRFGGMILDTGASCGETGCADASHLSNNGTAEFVSTLLDEGSYTEHSAVNEFGIYEGGSSITANEFNCWEEITDGTSEIVDSDGMLDKDRNYGFKQNETYTLKVTPTIRGREAGDYETSLSHNYVLRTGYALRTGAGIPYISPYVYSYAHVHVKTTIEITDVRQLIAAVATAKDTLANPGNHTEAYLTALRAAVDSVPVEMLRGVEYYTQEEVDKYYSDITSIPENVADYSEFVEVFEKMTAENSQKYTEESYSAFIDEIYEINKNLPKNLSVADQATVDAAVDALYAAHNKLVSVHLNDDNVFTQDDVGDDLSESFNPLEFSLASTEYNFMQVADGQTFAVETDISLRNTKTNYNLYFRGVGFFSEAGSDCGTDQGCHGLDNVAGNQTSFMVNACTGLNKYDAADDGGNIAEHSTWENISGPALASGGILIDDVSISTTESKAHAEMYYTGATGGQENNSAAYSGTYALWFGWWYHERTILYTKTYRHVHIPVTINITDARALNSLYGEVEDILNGKTEKTYTFESLLNLYDAYIATEEDMVYGDVYYTQEQVNTRYEALNAAYEALEEGADYSEYLEAYVKAQEIIASGNDDGYGNKLYDEATYNKLVDKVTTIHNGLVKDLPESEQETVDFATTQIKEAIDAANASKYADYTALEKAIIEAEKILAAEEGTYTEETLNALRQALADAKEVEPKNDGTADDYLYADDQATVDAVTSALEAAIAGMDFRADYSEMEDAYKDAQEIVNNPGNYSGDTVQAAKDAIAQADALSKDLADTAENRDKIEDVTEALKSAVTGAEDRADYSTYYSYIDFANSIDPNGYTGNSYGQFMAKVQEIDNGLPKNLPESEQGTVDTAANELLNAYGLLEARPATPSLNDEKVFTQDDISDEYTNGVFKFSLASTEYNFVQTVNDEKLTIGTDLIVNNANTGNYAVTLDSLKISAYNASEAASFCSDVCFNLDSVPSVTDSTSLFCPPNIDYKVITGVDYVYYTDSVTGEKTMTDGNGDMAWFTTWENVSGTALSTNGLLNKSTITEESSASANYVFASVGSYVFGQTGTGAAEIKDRTYNYVLRLGWTETDANGVSTQYHTHIPVTLNVTDARELYATYNAYKAFVDAGNDGTYTNASFQAAKDLVYSVDADVVYGLDYYTQDEVNAQTAILASALGALQAKADYSQVDSLVQQAEAMLNDTTKTYTQATIDALNDALAKEDALNRDLAANDESNAAIQDVVDALQAAINGAKEKADYSGLDEAIEEAQKIVDAPEGTYTEESVKAAQDALDAADALNKDLEKNDDNQAEINKVIEDLTNAATNAEYKANYDGLDEAIEEAQKIVDAPEGTYTEESVKAAQDALDAADALEKDLPASEQQTVTDVIQDLIDAATNAEKFADYSDYNTAKDEADNLVNDDGNGNPIYDEEAFEAYKEAVNNIDAGLEKDLLEDQQDVVDKATEELKNLRTELDATKGYEQEVIDPETTVDSIIEDVLQNSGYNADEVIFEFKDYTGAELAGEKFVGTGSTMRAILKSTGEIIDYKLYIVMGDVNGDGAVTMEDYEISVSVNLDEKTYTEEHNYFFIANDQDADGVIDVLDTFGIRRMVK